MSLHTSLLVFRARTGGSEGWRLKRALVLATLRLEIDVAPPATLIGNCKALPVDLVIMILFFLVKLQIFEEGEKGKEEGKD